MEDVRPLAPEQRDELDQTAEVAPGLSGRRTCSSAIARAPARRAAPSSGPGPWAATTTSNSSTSAGSSEATYVCAPPVSASVTTIKTRGRCRTFLLEGATLQPATWPG